jgi:hypothetical protein
MPRHQKAGRALLRLEGKLSLLPVVGLGLLGLLLGIWLVLIRAP